MKASSLDRAARALVICCSGVDRATFSRSIAKTAVCTSAESGSSRRARSTNGWARPSSPRPTQHRAMAKASSVVFSMGSRERSNSGGTSSDSGTATSAHAWSNRVMPSRCEGIGGSTSRSGSFPTGAPNVACRNIVMARPMSRAWNACAPRAYEARINGERSVPSALAWRMARS